MCRACGVTAVEAAPVRCSVCGAHDFEVVTPEMIERIAAVEGGLEEETSYDGRKLRWSEDARRALWTMKDAYQRRRAKARVEKSARMRRLDVVAFEFAKALIEEETGTVLVLPPRPARGEDATVASEEVAEVAPRDEVRLVARDDKNVPLTSALEWTPDAVQRVLRVPAGFMRNRTQERIESVARERGVAAIDLALVEEGIAIGRKMMEEAIAGYQANAETARAAYKAEDVTRQDAPASLNEVGMMSEMARRRGRAQAEDRKS
jgi:hypothetical protein